MLLRAVSSWYAITARTFPEEGVDSLAVRLVWIVGTGSPVLSTSSWWDDDSVESVCEAVGLDSPFVSWDWSVPFWVSWKNNICLGVCSQSVHPFFKLISLSRWNNTFLTGTSVVVTTWDFPGIYSDLSFFFPEVLKLLTVHTHLLCYAFIMGSLSAQGATEDRHFLQFGAILCLAHPTWIW